MNCKSCQSALPEVLLDPADARNASALAHIAGCSSCTQEFNSLQATFALLDTWTAPEVSPYFDQKMLVLLREEQAAPPLGWLERWKTRLLLNTGRQFRPALAAAMAVVLLVGGGSVGFSNFAHPAGAKTEASAAVNDLQILDRNAQALQEMDQLLQEDTTPDLSNALPHS